MQGVQIAFWYWWVAAALFIALEVFAPGAIFLWLGVAAAVVGLVGLLLPGLGWEVELLVFAVLSIAAVLGYRAYLRRSPIETDEPMLNRRGQQCIGRVFTLTEPIVDGRGRVKIGDTTWRCEGEDMPSGVKVKVTGVDGIVLKVERQDLL